MKTSKEKALELCMYFQELLFVNLTDENFIHSDSKKCAIRCIEEILNSCPTHPSEVYLSNWNFDYKQASIEESIQARTYWENVLEYIHLM